MYASVYWALIDSEDGLVPVRPQSISETMLVYHYCTSASNKIEM